MGLACLAGYALAKPPQLDAARLQTDSLKENRASAAAPGSAASAARPKALSGWSSTGQRLKPGEAAERFNLKNRLVEFDEHGKRSVRVVEGDLRIDGNLLLDWEEGFGSQGLVVTGELAVNGSIINAEGDYGPFLLVGGRTRAHAIVGGGSQLFFEGDVQVAEIVIGHYNHGSLVFKSNLTAPVVVSMDHHLEVRGKLDGRWFDDCPSWAFFLDMRRPGLSDMQKDEWEGLQNGLIPLLKNRQSVLRADLPPKEKLAAACTARHGNSKP